MPTYNTSIGRAESNDPLVPTPVASQIIQAMPNASALLQLLPEVNIVPMSSKTSRQPVLSALPEAYFVSGDTGLKQTGSQQWENLELVAEELAVIVPIPEAYLDDSQIPIWDQVRPRVASAFGRKLDAAAFFGASLPATWGDPIVQTAYNAGNVVTEGDTDDLASDLALVGQKVAEDGFDVNGFAVAPGFRWRLRGLRSEDGIPIYHPPAGADPGTLFGEPLPHVKNGAWQAADATAIAGDWTNVVVGVRQDITFKVFTEGVISDGDGAVVLNLMQQDSVALRAVMRLAYQVANPVTEVNSDDETRFPFGVLEPTEAAASV